MLWLWIIVGALIGFGSVLAMAEASIAALAGIGFTVALFITELAFDDAHDADGAKLAVLVASVLAGLVGAVVLRGAGVGRSRLRRFPTTPGP